MATEFSEIGKSAAIEKLFKSSGYVNEYGMVLENGGETLTSVHRLFLENVDFDLTYNPMRHLGYKLTLCVIGESYAKISTVSALQTVVGISNRFSFEDIRDLWNGVVAAAKEHDIRHLSLDLVPSASGLVFSISTIGRQDKKVKEFTGKASSGDLILLSGNVGAAYMGMHVLEREKVAFNRSASGTDAAQPDLSKYKYILEQYLSPEVKSGIVARFAEAGIYPSYGYFVTRGLGDAVKRLSADSGLGAKLYIGKIPISSKTFEMAEELNIDPITSAINGGEDYRLMFVVPLASHELFRKDFQDYDIIGHLARPEVGSVLVTPEGAEIEIKAQAYK